jgi:hypothetical protein
MSVTGNTIIITNKSNVTYTIDATNVKFVKANAISAIGSVLIGDTVIVQGTVTGQNVIASSIIDNGVTSTQSITQTQMRHQKGRGSFFVGIGNFFHNLFGFF